MLRNILVSLISLFCLPLFHATAQVYRYSFSSTPLPVALMKLSTDHPDINISFIYDELENYSADADLSTDDPYEALRLIVSRLPVYITREGNNFFLEAMQKGKYSYRGNIIDSSRTPVVSATVLVLQPGDSTVLTFGIADTLGRFSIPCDRPDVILKISSLGHRTLSIGYPPFDCGTIILPDNPLALKAVTVEAAIATVESDKSTFVPSARQKSASITAIDLLRHMAIPLINVSPDNSVTDNFGKKVPIFINSVLAAAEEISGINISDVRRVEILDFPTDPRFRNVPKAINLIVQEYVYGGYTKLSATESCLAGFSNSASVFSKFSYGSMTYDLYVGTDNTSTHLFGSNSESRFLLGEGDNKHSVTRIESIEKSRQRSNQFPVTFRATYNSEIFQLRNTLSFTHSATPESYLDGTLHISTDPDSDNSFRRSSPQHSNSATYSGDWSAKWASGYSINIVPTFYFTHRNNLTDNYNSTGLAINRHASEDALYYRLDVYGSREFARYHTVSAELNYGNSVNRIRYSGSYSASGHFENPFVVAGLKYNFRKNKTMLYFATGICLEWVEINNRNSTDRYPFVHLFTRLAPDPRHAFSFFVQFANNTPGISLRSADILRENEFLYFTGNPDLKNCRHFTFEGSYTWQPSNNFNINFFGEYFSMFDCGATVYRPYLNGTALIRNFINDGNFTLIEAGTSADVRMFGNSLQLSANYTQTLYKSSGTPSHNLWRGDFRLQATCYVGKGYLQAFWSTPSARLNYMYNSVTYTRNQHGITCGIGMGNLKLSLTASNIFNRGNRGETTRLITPLYSEYVVSRSGAYHPKLMFSASFTIGYGRKVSRDNEIGIQSSASSGILSY